MFIRWREEIERRRRDDLKSLDARGWSGKLDGLTLRIAATIHLMGEVTGQIDAQEMRRAIAIVGWGIEHAKAVSFGTCDAGVNIAQQ